MLRQTNYLQSALYNVDTSLFRTLKPTAGMGQEEEEAEGGEVVEVADVATHITGEEEEEEVGEAVVVDEGED